MIRYPETPVLCALVLISHPPTLPAGGDTRFDPGRKTVPEPSVESNGTRTQQRNGVAGPDRGRTEYHLTRLQAVGLVEVVGTWYSKKGREMAVYGAKNDPMVIFAGEADREAVISAWR